MLQATLIGIINTAFVWRPGNGEWVAANLGALLALVVLWLAQLPLLALAAFHAWCACASATTWETARGAGGLWYLEGLHAKDCDLPFSGASPAANCAAFCCELEAWDCAPACGKPEATWAPREWTPRMLQDRDARDPLQLWENHWWSCC